MKRAMVLLSIILMLCSCSKEIVPVGTLDSGPVIFPDYVDVTVPINIAPLNFEVMPSEQTKGVCVVVTSETMKYTINADGNQIRFGKRFWKSLLEENKGKNINLTICEKRMEGWYAYEPFDIRVAEDEIDPFIAYRLVNPGYSLWSEMGIYQRNLENYRQTLVYSNMQGHGNCVNCHSFHDRDADRMLFHLRSEQAGTYLIEGKSIEKLNTKTDSTMSALVYPFWHPDGNLVAFSVNKTNQVLHARNPNRIEVFDESSDVVVYDVDRHEIVTADILSSTDAFETFPTFSPDGRSLYFCSAEAVDPMPEKFRDVKYSLCRVDFNPEDRSFGTVTDTLYNAKTEGGSVSFPRISPDGRFLVFALSDYGNFSIWHKEADLYMLDLYTGEICNMDKLNSNDVESYHSWSSNSRWLVFSSRRDDGLYTKLYFAYIDADGTVHKPFLLPQKDPRAYYDEQMYSYNIPEFVNGKVKVNGNDIAAFAQEDEGIQVTFKRL